MGAPMTDQTKREEALALGRAKKAARRRRTGRIRRSVAVLAAAAFIGPLGAIYAHDRATGSTTVAAAVQPSTTTTAAPTTTTTTPSATSTPSAVTTRQS